MKKVVKIICITIVAVLLVSIGLYAYAVTGQTEDENNPASKLYKICYNIGLVDKRPICEQNIYAKGKDITIYTDELNKIAEKHKISDPTLSDEDATKRAFDYLVRRDSLYQAAVDKGYTVTDKEVQEYVNKQIESTKKARESGGTSDFDVFLKGVGMTEEEYWQSQYDVLKKELVTTKYLEPIRSDFLANSKDKDPYKAWNEELDKIADKHIKEQDVKILD